MFHQSKKNAISVFTEQIGIIKGRNKMNRRRDIGWWSVVRTGFPYSSGYGTYNRRTRTLLDSGLPKWQAKHICKELNRNKRKRFIEDMKKFFRRK